MRHVVPFLLLIDFLFPFFLRSVYIVVFNVSVVDVDGLERSGSGSSFCLFPTALYVFGFEASCAYVVRGCAEFVFILCLVPMDWANSSILVMIPIRRSWVVCQLSLICVFVFELLLLSLGVVLYRVKLFRVAVEMLAGSLSVG